jgi:hypothetical protein
LRLVVLMLLPVMSSMRMTCFGNLIGQWPSCPKQVEKFLRLLRKVSCPSQTYLPRCATLSPTSWRGLMVSVPTLPAPRDVMRPNRKARGF